MNKHSSHIISRFRWNTILDRKERAVELQERLSAWSDLDMQKVVADVFDKLCPPEQVWQIPSLELDLGEIELNSLEFELGTRLRRELNEKVIKVISCNTSSEIALEVLDKKASRIEMLRSFFLCGVMPWNYKTAYGPVNAILALLLQNSGEQLIEMIEEAGSTYEDVRKRIASQIHEPLLIKIIEGLEPGNHTQIISFFTEITNIQEKEAIVKSGSKDIKKNMWFWILNYLFTERGTVFNKLAFMKSNIRQMANHYNMGYDELFELIERAADKVSEMGLVKADFILSLRALSKERQSSKSKIFSANIEADPWLTMESFFRDDSLLRSKNKKIKFNEFIVGLCKKDTATSTSLIRFLGNSTRVSTDAMRVLDKISLEAIFSALRSTSPPILIESICFLDTISRRTNLNITRNQWLQLGMKYMQNKGKASFEINDFLDYCISNIAKGDQEATIQILDKLVNATIPSSLKTVSSLEIYTKLNTILVAAISRSSISLSGNFDTLLSKLCGQLNNPLADKKLFVSLIKSVTKKILQHPRIALEAMINYPDKEGLLLLIPHLAYPHIANLLIKNAREDQYSNLMVLHRVLTAQSVNNNKRELAEWIDEKLGTLGLHTIIFHPGLKQLQFLHYMLEKIRRTIPPIYFEQFNRLTGNFLLDKKLNTYGFSPFATNTIVKNPGETVTLSLLAQLNKLMLAPGNKRAEAARLLLTNFNDDEFARLRKSKNEESKRLLNYILKGGDQLMDLLIKKYALILCNELKQFSKSKVILSLHELYWKCLLDYTSHLGRIEALKKSFDNAVIFHFPISKNILIHIRQRNLGEIENKQWWLKNGEGLAPGEVLLMVEECLTKRYQSIKDKGKEVNAGKLSDITTKLYPPVVNYILSRLVIAGNGNALLNPNILFRWSSDAKLQNGDLLSATEVLLLLEECFTKGVASPEDKGKEIGVVEPGDIAFGVFPGAVTPILSSLALETKNKQYRLKCGHVLSDDDVLLLLEECLAKEILSIENKGKEISAGELISFAIRLQPAIVRRILSGITISENKIEFLKKAISFDQFCCYILHDRSGLVTEILEAIRLFYDIVSNVLALHGVRPLVNKFWKQAWLLINTDDASEAGLKKLVGEVFQRLAIDYAINSQQVISVIKEQGPRMNLVLKDALTQHIPASAFETERAKLPSEKLSQLQRKGVLPEFCLSLVTQHQGPAWFGTLSEHEVKEMLNELVIYYPMTLFTILKRQIISESQILWLNSAINIKELVQSIGSLHKNKQGILGILEKFYMSFNSISLKTASSKECQYILFRKLIKAWMDNNWRIISTPNIWNELLWDICTKRGVARKSFMREIEQVKAHFPPALQVSWEQLKAKDKASVMATEKAVLQKQLQTPLIRKDMRVSKSGIAIRNAGLVLINSYVPLLFERIGIVNNKKFTDITIQSDAVHYLQYVVTGLQSTEEIFLPLNKVLCGLPLSQPIANGITISEKQRNLIEGLIQAAITYWPSIGNCSINGFRGNWLVREGLLTEQDDRWELIVEKRSYDLLIHRSPFSFSVIKYPWMNKPLHVTWPY